MGRVDRLIPVVGAALEHLSQERETHIRHFSTSERLSATCTTHQSPWWLTTSLDSSTRLREMRKQGFNAIRLPRSAISNLPKSFSRTESKAAIKTAFAEWEE